MSAKFRTSCDTCHSAKIKCKKTDTGCQRCDNSVGGQICNFSPALPRIYRKKPNHRHLEGSQVSVPETSTLVHDLYDSQATLGQKLYIPEAASLSTYDQQIYGLGVNPEPNSFSWQYLPQSSIEVPQNPDLWSSNVDAASNTTALPVGLDATSPATIASTTSSMPVAYQPRAIDIQGSRHCPSAERCVPSPEIECAKTPCSCFALLFEAMQCLSEHATTRSPKLDIVLSSNRTAAKHCLTALQCSYPFTASSYNGVSGCTIIACGLLDRILASYQTAMVTFCASLAGEESAGSEQQDHETMGEREGDERQNLNLHTTTVQVRIGVFALERDEQILWAKEIVVKEAEKIQRTVKELADECEGVQSALLTHLMEKYKAVIVQVSAS